MDQAEALEWLGELTRRWVADPASDVVYCEQVGPRWAVRVRQQTRDFTTVWLEVGERTLRYEAYVVPSIDAVEAHRLALRWNERAWRVHFSLGAEGDLYLRGRIDLQLLSEHEVESALGEIYDLVEISFRPLLRVVREKKGS